MVGLRRAVGDCSILSFFAVFSIRNLDLLLLLAVSTSLTATVLYRDRAWTVEAEGGPLLTRVNTDGGCAGRG